MAVQERKGSSADQSGNARRPSACVWGHGPLSLTPDRVVHVVKREEVLSLLSHMDATVATVVRLRRRDTRRALRSIVTWS